MTPAFEYVTYGRMDELHQLQSPRTGARAELNFILLSQAEELLFRAVGDDLHTAREALGGDRVEDACAALARAARTQRALLACWEPMNGMTADEFVAFREVLKNASGEQSVTYRSLEFLLGNRPERHVGTVRREGTPLLAEELGRPSLYDTALVWLAGRDVSIRPPRPALPGPASTSRGRRSRTPGWRSTGIPEPIHRNSAWRRACSKSPISSPCGGPLICSSSNGCSGVKGGPAEPTVPPGSGSSTNTDSSRSCGRSGRDSEHDGDGRPASTGEGKS